MGWLGKEERLSHTEKLTIVNKILVYYILSSPGEATHARAQDVYVGLRRKWQDKVGPGKVKQEEMKGSVRSNGSQLKDVGRIISNAEAHELAVEITAELISIEDDEHICVEDVASLNHQNGLIKWLEGDKKVIRGMESEISSDGAKKKKGSM